MARKLEKSMLFGKPLAMLNFQRLLEGLMPGDIENLYILDADGKQLYQRKDSAQAEEIPGEDRMPGRRFYRISVPLEKNGKAVGEIVTVVSTAYVRERLSSIIRESLYNSLIIIAVVLPLLYLILIFWVDRPYVRQVRSLTRALKERNHERLEKEGIDTRNLMEAESIIDQITNGKWIMDQEEGVYEKLRLYLRINRAIAAAMASGIDPATAVRETVDWEEFSKSLDETEAILREKEMRDTLMSAIKALQKEEAAG